MKVNLLHNTPLWVASTAIRKCWASEDKSDSEVYEDCEVSILTSPTQGEVISRIRIQKTGTKDKELIHRVGNKNKHSSTLEHLNYSFDIDGISRACLQEVARHRHASVSVKSTRYTLKELKSEVEFVLRNERYNDYDIERAKRYLVLPQHAVQYDKVWQTQVVQLDMLRELLVLAKDTNDVNKYCLPEAYKTSLVLTINARSLQNFLSLRTDKSALWEIQDLAHELYKQLPDEHKYLFEEFVKENK